MAHPSVGSGASLPHRRLIVERFASDYVSIEQDFQSRAFLAGGNARKR
jgi:hypothetical protein